MAFLYHLLSIMQWIFSLTLSKIPYIGTFSLILVVQVPGSWYTSTHVVPVIKCHTYLTVFDTISMEAVWKPYQIRRFWTFKGSYFVHSLFWFVRMIVALLVTRAHSDQRQSANSLPEIRLFPTFCSYILCSPCTFEAARIHRLGTLDGRYQCSSDVNIKGLKNLLQSDLLPRCQIWEIWSKEIFLGQRT